MATRELQPNNELNSAWEAIRQEYARRRYHPSSSSGLTMFESRLRWYEKAFQVAALLPLRGRRILDPGCGTGKWLDICCQRWQAEPRHCFGFDLWPDSIRAWRQAHPDSPITLKCQPAHEIDFDDTSFNVEHQSMMFSSGLSAGLRLRMAGQMWRVLRSSGCICSYDFWIRALNKVTVGIRLRRLRRLVTQAHLVFRKTTALVSAVCRVVKGLNERLSLAADKLRLMTTHQLVILAKS